MRIEVKFFAVLRDLAGAADLQLDLPAGATAAAAVETLLVQCPALREQARQAAVAVNRVYAVRTTVLRDGDELALIPPVSGGV